MVDAAAYEFAEVSVHTHDEIFTFMVDFHICLNVFTGEAAPRYCCDCYITASQGEIILPY